MKLILKNLFSLGAIQAVGLLIPIILTPYLINHIGIELFGVIVTAQGFVLFFNVLTDFGFNITAVRRIAQSSGKKKEIDQIVNGVFFLKLVLLTFAFLVFLLLICFIPHFQRYFFIYLCSFVIVIGQAILPIWYYQGIEQINKTLLPVFIFKLLTVASVIILVKDASDAPYVNIIYGLANLLPGIYLFRKIAMNHRLSIHFANFASLKKEFTINFPIFLSNSGVLIYSNSNVLLLSFFIQPAQLGIYSVAEKIIQLLKTLLIVIHQVTYPRVCILLRENNARSFAFLKKLYSLIWVGIFFICLVIFIFPGFTVSFFVNETTQQAQSALFLRYLSFLVLVIVLNMPFYQGLLALHKDWLCVRIMIICSILSLVLNIILVPVFGIKGLIFTSYFTEFIVTGLFIYFMLKTQKNEYGRNQLYR